MSIINSLLGWDSFIDVHYFNGKWRLRRVHFLIDGCQLEDIIVEMIFVDFGLMLFTHYMSIVIIVLLLADRTVGMFLIWLRKNYFSRFLYSLSHLFVMLNQLLLLVSLKGTPIDAQDEGTCEIFAVKVEDREGEFGQPGFSVVLGTKRGNSIVLGVGWMVEGKLMVLAACFAPPFGFLHFYECA